MFLSKNDLPSLRKYFSVELPSFSATELQSMLKQLVLKRFNWSEVDFMLNKDLLFSESDLLYFRSAVKRLQKNEPFQHIIGEVEFYGVILKADSRALIPRPETEELVDWILSGENLHQENRILDLCSGSGCIAFALKSRLKESIVDCVEWSPEAINLIEENKKETGLNVNVLKMDVLSESSYSDFQEDFFDIWVSNPPYIPHSDKAVMSENVLDFEPGMALFVEDNAPFVFYNRIAQQGQRFLKEKGCLYFEIHENYAKEVMQILSDYNFVNIELRKDLQGKDRMIKAQKVSSRYESERS